MNEKEIKREESQSTIRTNLNTTLLLLVALFLILGLVGYVYKKLEDNKSVAPVLSKELKEIDLTKIEKLTPKIDRELRNLYEGIPEYMPTKENTGNDMNLELNNGTLKYTFNEEVFTIDNVKMLKTDQIPYEILLFVFTNDNELWYCDISNDVYMGQKVSAPVFKKLSGKYTDVKMLHMANSGASDIRDYLLLSENKEYYTLNNEILYDLEFAEQINYKHYELMNSYIRTNGDIYFNNVKTNTKYKFGIYSLVGGDIQYIISTDNYLYDSNLKKYSNSKIQKVLYSEDSYMYEIQFEDGTKLENTMFKINLN